MNNFTGTIVEESLEDNRILNSLKIIGFRVSKDDNPLDRWHLYKVDISKDQIQSLLEHIKPGKWYMHFWKNREVIVVFKDKIFEFNYDDKSMWSEAIKHGRSLGIPDEQLDFVIE